LTKTQVKTIYEKNVNSIKFLHKIKSYNPDINVVAGFSQIFKKELLKIPRLGTINLHGGKLPKYRGGSPLNWQIINGEKKIGISAILMDEGIDSGRILASTDFSLKDGDSISSVHKKANQLFPRILLKAIRMVILKGRRAGLPQPTSTACYWHQRNDEDGEVCFRSMKSKQVLSKIRALSHPYPGAWVRFRGRKVRIFKAELPVIPVCGSPGKILFLKGKGPFVICKDRALLLTETKPSIKAQAPSYIDR
jgi:methionyl-tRNA formyltransferase